MEEYLIFNPLNDDFIQTTGSTWSHLMEHQGGFIAYDGVLMPIDLKALVLWECSSTEHHLLLDSPSSPSLDLSSDYNTSGYPKNVREDTWSVILAHPVEGTCSTVMVETDPTLYPFMDELLFVNKPAKMLTLPGIGKEKEKCLASEVNAWLYGSKEGSKVMSFATKSLQTIPSTKKKKFQGNKKLPTKNNNALTNRYLVRPCHRLDFDTSGVIIMGLTPESHRKTSFLFEQRHVSKTYIALVAGHVSKDSGIISYPIGKVHCTRGDYNEFACYTGCNGPALSDFINGSIREAETEFFVANRFSIPVFALQQSNVTAKYTRIILKPKTGRGHQLRLHLAAIGHPILGDRLHSQSSHIQRCTPRLCLHAEELQVTALMGNMTSSIIKIQSIAPF